MIYFSRPEEILQSLNTIGSKFDVFLQEEGILKDCKEEAAKNMLVL